VRNKPKRRVRVLAALLLACVLLSRLSAPAAAAGEQVRVGWFPLNGFFDVTPEGALTGYGREFTEAVASHTGWECEYVRYANWSAALDALSAGEIDLLAPAQHTPERDAQFTFDTFPIGTEYGALLTRSDNNALVYEDYGAFGDLRIGAVKSLVFLDAFRDYARQNGFTPALSYYNDTTSLLAALNAGEVDAVVVNLMVKTDGMKLLAKFGSAPYYYMFSPQSDSLRAGLNQAIDRLTTQHPEFLGELTERWFPAYSNIPLSRQELDYIASAGVLKAACGADCAPYSYVDDDSGEVRGVDRAVLERVSALTGLQFDYVSIPFGEDLTEFAKADGVALIAGVEHGADTILHDENCTEPYLTGSKYFMGRVGEHFDPDGEAQVAVVSAYDALTARRQAYPHFRFVRYPSAEACIQALRSGSADLILSNRYAMERLLAAPRNQDLQFLPAEAVENEICCKVMPAEHSDLLVSVLNKAIKQISATETAQYIDDELHATRYVYGFPDFFYQYRYALTALAVIVCFGIVSVTLVLRARRRSLRLIKRDEAKLRHISNNINGGVVVLQADDTLEILYANKGYAELTGCTEELTGTSFLDCVQLSDRPKVCNVARSDTREQSFELQMLRVDGSCVPALCNCTAGETIDGVRELYCVILDLTEQNKLLDELRIGSRRTELILERVEEIFYEVDLREEIITTSPSFFEKLGWEFSGNSGQLTSENFDKMWHASPEDIQKLHDDTRRMMAEKKPIATMMRIEAKQRGDIWCEVLQYPILTEDGGLASIIGLIRDIDRQVTEREQLVEQTRRDPLTGLYNKEAFEAMATEALVQLPGQNHALIFLDLDHFKSVNDTLGHMTGDQVICEAADKLRLIFSNYDLVSRFGGDEFCVFVKNIPTDTLRGKLDWLVEKLRGEYNGSGGSVRVTCSCGVACTEHCGSDYAMLMRCADQALYHSKKRGRDRYTFYSDIFAEDQSAGEESV
jgi:diguanylate cyclase (GGDEF)-like protein/PAS domain S-box-containing protein